jgi:hypothetical protein
VFKSYIDFGKYRFFNGGKHMNLFKRKVISALTVMVMLFAFPNVSSAQELNTNGFSGFINTTITTGITVRGEDNDCSLQDGYAGLADLNATGDAIFAGQTELFRSTALNVKTKK